MIKRNLLTLLGITTLTALVLMLTLSVTTRSANSKIEAISLGATYSQNFDSLATTGTTNPFTNDLTLVGWYSNRTLYIADAGTSNSGGLHSHGITSTAERALGSVGSGSAATVLYGVRMVNDTGSAIASFIITYTGEEWRSGTNLNTLEFAYQTGTVVTDIVAGTWITVPAMNFTGPNTAATAGPLDGNASANRRVISGSVTVTVPAGNEIMFRWRDIDDVGSDQGVAVDDLTIVPVSGPPQADLGVSKDGPATALASDVFTYTINLSNTGNYTATGTIVTDTLPIEVAFVTYTTALPVNSFTQNGQDLIWDLGDVPTMTANATLSVRVAVSPTVLNGTSFTNTVAGTTTYTETNLANNGDFATTFIGAPDLVVVKTGPANVNAGDTFTYTLAYSNAGSLNATGVAIVDQLPAGVSFVTETTASAVAANGRITWTLGTLNASAGSSIEVAVTADNAGDWVNAATISGGPIDSNLLNNTASVTTTINGADVYVLKTGPAVAFGGELISYTIAYGNSGNLTATATLTDQLPISFTVSDIAFDGRGQPFVDGAGSRVWSIELAPNTEMSFTFALTVPTTISNSTRITNSLSISALEAGDDPSDNAAAASSTVYQIVPIATARAGAVGQVFGVEGSVTYVPGTYNSSGWALQDASGGIAVFFNPPASVQLGDRVRLVATRGVNAGEVQLASTVYYSANLGAGPQVTPRPYTTAQIASGTTEGWLAIVTGTVSSVPATCVGIHQLNINDGSGATVIFVDDTTTINICNLGIANGDRVVFTGFSTQFNGTFEIKPRFPADVKRLFDVTFVYHDQEDVVHVGEDVQLRGDFTNWDTNPITLAHDAGYTVFSVTVTLPVTGVQNYRYYVPGAGASGYEWLNSGQRFVQVIGGVTLKNDYRTVFPDAGALQGPALMTVNLGQATPVVSATVLITGVTDYDGAPGRGLKAEVGYGANVDPSTWTWSASAFIAKSGGNDVYGGAFTPTAGGVYSYAVRFNANWGAGNPGAGDWTYVDLNGAPFTLDQAGVLTVTAPQLSLAKGVEKPASEMQLGDVVTYTLELSNGGDGPASGVLITDVLPAEVTFGGFVQQNGAAYAGGTLTWSGSLNTGVTATVIFTATVGNQRAFYGRTVTNTAQFTSSNGGSDSAEAAFQIVNRYFIFTPLIRR